MWSQHDNYIFKTCRKFALKIQTCRPSTICPLPSSLTSSMNTPILVHISITLTCLFLDLKFSLLTQGRWFPLLGIISAPRCVLGCLLFIFSLVRCFLTNQSNELLFLNANPFLPSALFFIHLLKVLIHKLHAFFLCLSTRM